ncbi:MAG: MoaD/ThiS family protein [Dehalococcoidia bacterium]
MATVWIPSLLRDLCGGDDRVTVAGETVAEAFERLDEACPGIRGRVLDGGRVKPGITVFVDGEEMESLRQSLRPESEIQILPAMGGGQAL